MNILDVDATLIPGMYYQSASFERKMYYQLLLGKCGDWMAQAARLNGCWCGRLSAVRMGSCGVDYWIFFFGRPGNRDVT